MKFEMWKFWKHKNCTDVFFCVNTVSFDDGKTTNLSGYWCTQGINSWWFSTEELDSISITEKHYDNWLTYVPYMDISA